MSLRSVLPPEGPETEAALQMSNCREDGPCKLAIAVVIALDASMEVVSRLGSRYVNF